MDLPVQYRRVRVFPSSMTPIPVRILLSLAVVVRLSAGAVLSVPSQSASAGQLLATAVTLSTEGAQISGLQFDLEWDPALELQIASGQELIHSDKLLYS